MKKTIFFICAVILGISASVAETPCATTSLSSTLLVSASSVSIPEGSTCFTANSQTISIPSTSDESPQVCQFSLSKYRGKISMGRTQNFTVSLSCPQKEVQRATVVVFIDGEHTASTVVDIPAGEVSSASVYINVGMEYDGEEYKLGVQ